MSAPSAGCSLLRNIDTTADRTGQRRYVRLLEHRVQVPRHPERFNLGGNAGPRKTRVAEVPNARFPRHGYGEPSLVESRVVEPECPVIHTSHVVGLSPCQPSCDLEPGREMAQPRRMHGLETGSAFLAGRLLALAQALWRRHGPRNDGVSAIRQFSDYAVLIDDQSLPEGVTLTRLAG